MRFTLLLIGTALSAGMLGGAVSHLHATGKLGAVDALVDIAKDTFRDTMRDLDGSYYERGPTYAACTKAYGPRAAGLRTNAEVTLSCECFDKQIGALGGLDRETAMKALGPEAAESPDVAPKTVNYAITGPAMRVLRKCDITPWPQKPSLLRHPI